MDSGWCLRGSEVPTIFKLWDSHGFPATNLNPFPLMVRHNLGNALASLGHGTAVWELNMHQLPKMKEIHSIPA